VHDATNCGFSDAEPWLPLGPDHAARAVDVQDSDPASLLSLTRELVALRNAHPAMLTGKLTILEARDNLLVFERIETGSHLLCAYNFGDSDIAWQPAQPDRWRVIESVNGAAAGKLPPFGALIASQIA
jgi:alpha-glucosidase